jgi:hypothetical protein
MSHVELKLDGKYLLQNEYNLDVFCLIISIVEAIPVFPES